MLSLPRFLRALLFSLLLLVLLFGVSVPAASAQEETFTGTINTLIFDYPDSAKTKRELRLSDGRVLNLKLKGKLKKELLSGSKVRVTGKRPKANVIEANAENVQVLNVAAAAVSGTRKAVVLVLNFNDGSLSCNSTAAATMFTGTRNVDGLYKESSFGQLSFPGDTNGDSQPDVFGPFNVNYSVSGSCDYNGWASAADSAATQAGVNLSLYQHRVYVFPPVASCGGWVGLGNLGCGTYCRIWIRGDYCGGGDVYAHELAHNLGMHHASTDPGNDGTGDVEYGDTSCIMGYGGVGWRHFNARHKDQMGWFPAANVQNIGAGSHTLTPVEANASGVQVLKFPRTASTTYYISYRAPLGTYSPNLSSTYSYKTNIHYSKGDGYSYFVKALANGETFSDPASGLTLTQVSSSSAGATITTGLTCAPLAPTLSVSPASYLTKTAGAQAEYIVTVTNRDANCSGSTRFDVSALVPAGWTSNSSSSSVLLGSGQSGAVSVVVTSAAGAAQGTYSIGFRAQDNDALDPAHPEASASASYIIDNQPPAAITNLKASIVKSKIALSWTQPSDGSGSGIKEYRVYKNGSQLTTTANTNYTDASVTAGVTYTYVVYSVDRAGNVSAASNSVQAMVPKKGKPARK